MQDAIHQIKKAFNQEFNDTFAQKEQEVKRIIERNQRIQKILNDLELKENVFKPEMTDEEKPERLLVVRDEEVPFEKFISPEEQARLDELARIEEGELF